MSVSKKQLIANQENGATLHQGLATPRKKIKKQQNEPIFM